MPRPTFIIAEPEPIGAISARKLVLETAKFNVITGHSEDELLELVERFPAASAIVIHRELVPDDRVAALIGEAKWMAHGKPVILLTTNKRADAGLGDHLVDSHEPQELLQLLRQLFGDPRQESTSRKIA